METATVEEAVHYADFQWRDGAIIPDEPVEQLAASVDTGKLVVLPKLCPAKEMLALRREVLAWAQVTDPWPQGVSASKPGINFHRIDDGSIGGRLPHVFHQFGFGDFTALPDALNECLIPLAEAMCHFQNQLAGTDYQLNGGSFRIKILRHPPGGGHLVWHRHPYLPQKVELFVNLSQPGVDYQSGGASFKTPAGKLESFHCYDIGDLLAWRYDMIHNVDPVDPEESVDWSKDDGFWILAMEMIESHDNSTVEE
ncbi:MAG: hypothetical protein AAGD22_04465 [Verrucomicrobiota bacterium]